MSKERLPRIMTKKDSYTFDYPQAEELIERQLKMMWFPEEITVEKDIHCIMTELTEAEKHGVITTLKLFTNYELVLGNEYWGGVVGKYMPRPEIQKMANMFSFFELNIHAPFYDKINKALGLATDEFYTSYLEDETLNARMNFLDGLVSQAKTNLPLSLAIFSMVEGAVLYSSFAFLKHFESNGKNKITNIVAGVNLSLQDELVHAEGGSWLYRQLLDELKLPAERRDELECEILEAAEVLREHEHRIADMIFEKGDMGPNGVTKKQVKDFISHRVQVCLLQLGIQSLLPDDYDNTIEKWFYSGADGFILHDFFSKVGREYERKWVKSNFNWGSE